MRRRAWIAGVIILVSSASFAAEHLLAWVALGEAKRVEVLDLTAESVLASFEVDAEPTHLSMSPDLEYLYVSCRADGQTHVLRPISGNLVKRLPYIFPVFSPTDSQHYYAPGLGGVFRYEVDGYRFEQLAYLPDTQNSYAYVVSDDAEWFVYIQRFVDWRDQGISDPPLYDRVTVCNLEEATGQYVNLGAEPLSVAVAPAGDRAVIGCVNGNVYVVSLGDDPAVIYTREMGKPIRFVGFTGDDKEIIFSYEDRIYTTSVTVTEESPIDPALQEIAIGGSEIIDGALAPDGSLVVADAAGMLSLIDLNEKTVNLRFPLERGINDLILALVDEENL